MRRYLVLMAFFMLLSSGAALAQQSGTLTGFLRQPPPADRVIAVETRDDTEFNLRIAEQFRAALSNAGYALRDDAATVLSFESFAIRGALPAGGPRGVVRLQTTQGSGTGDRTNVEIDLFSTRRDAILSGPVPEGRPDDDIRFSVEFTLDDRSQGTRYWQGEAAASGAQEAREQLTAALARQIVAHLGEDVRALTIPLE